MSAGTAIATEPYEWRASTGEGPPRNRARRLPPGTGVVGMMIFLSTEAMFFAGLMSAFVILRAGAMMWPPAGQPRLPIAVTAVNTLVLLASGVTMRRALRAIRADHRHALTTWLLVTAVLGGAFLVIQGSEWIRLVHHGLTMTSSMYGALFYTLIGAHGVHVLGAMVALLLVLGRARQGRYSASAHGGVELCWIYWCFVVGVWPVLYVLVYLG